MTDGDTEQENDSKKASTATTSEPSSTNQHAETGRSKAATHNKGWARQFFWLDARLAEAKRLGFGEESKGFAEFRLAKQARSGIIQIGETGESNVAVLLLERIEVFCLIRSHLLKEGLPCEGKGFLTREDLETARSLKRVQEAWHDLSTAQQNAIETALGPDAELALAKLEAKNRRGLAMGLRKLSSALVEPLEFEANRVGRVLFVRWARIAGAAVAALAVVMAGVGVYKKATAKPNLALHRPVTISSQYPNEGIDHSLLVDGDTTNLGFHTLANGPQHCIIDLGAPKAFNTVVVTNRTDCCHERAVPLQLQVSDDGQNYRTIAERREVFDVWTADGLKTRARYVKLQLTGSNYLHLAEVEVY